MSVVQNGEADVAIAVAAEKARRHKGADKTAVQSVEGKEDRWSVSSSFKHELPTRILPTDFNILRALAKKMRAAEHSSGFARIGFSEGGLEIQ
jgi:hypothetical protein